MSAYSLALDCKLEGRVRTPLSELVEYYRNKEEYELFLEEQAKGTKMINRLKKDLEKLGYSLVERNKCIDLVEKQVNCPDSQLNTEDEVFRVVDVASDEHFDPENKLFKIFTTMSFETKDGRCFDVEIEKEETAIWDEDWRDYDYGKRVFLDIELKK